MKKIGNTKLVFLKVFLLISIVNPHNESQSKVKLKTDPQKDIPEKNNREAE